MFVFDKCKTVNYLAILKSNKISTLTNVYVLNAPIITIRFALNMHKKSDMQILANKYNYIYANVALKISNKFMA